MKTVFLVRLFDYDELVDLEIHSSKEKAITAVKAFVTSKDKEATIEEKEVL